MARKRNCRDCKKELTDKYFIITCIGAYEASRANFCSLCCDKRKNARFTVRLIKEGGAEVVEKEAGDKLMDDISAFEDKWGKNTNLGISKIILPDNKTFLNSIRQSRQELEPYLQKPEVVEKAWLKEYHNDIDMSFDFLFAKNVREKDYKQKVVQPTLEEILGEKLDGEINITTTGNSPGVPGRADGKFKINGKFIGYNWIDHENECRRLRLSFWDDNKLAFQAFFRSLNIKEKELQGENDRPPQPNQPVNNKSSHDGLSNGVIITLLGGGILFLGIIVLLLIRKGKINKKQKK